MEFVTNRQLPPFAAVGMARRSGMAIRLRNILAQGQHRSRASRRLSFSIGIGFVLIGAGFAACSSTTPKSVIPEPILPLDNRPAQSEAKFRSGGTARILYVGPSSSKEPTWNADGSPSDPDVQKKSGYRYTGSDPGDGKRVVQLYYEIADLPKMDPSVFHNGPQQLPARLGGVSTTGFSGSLGQSIRGLVGFTVPTKWSTADLEVAIGKGEFQPGAENHGGQGDLQVKVDPQTGRQSASGPNGKSIVKDVNFSKISVTIPTKFRGKDWRLFAFDKSGKQIPVLVNGPIRFGPEKGGWEASCLVDPYEIDRFVLKVRDFDWVKLKRIRLYPDTVAQRQSGVQQFPGFSQDEAAVHTSYPAAKFKSGATVRIIDIGCGPTSQGVWDENGNPTLRTIRAKDGTTIGGGSGLQNGIRSIHVCYEINDLSRKYLQEMGLPQVGPARLGGIPFKGGGTGIGTNIQHTYQFAVPAGWKTADLEVALGVGNFKAIAECPSTGGGALRLKIIPRKDASGNSAGGQKSPVVQKGYPTQLAFLPPAKVKGMEWRLCAYDKEGKLMMPVIVQPGAWPGEERGTCHAMVTNMSAVHDPLNAPGVTEAAKYVLEARDYEWVTVKDVHLYPLKQTN